MNIDFKAITNQASSEIIINLAAIKVHSSVVTTKMSDLLLPL